MAEYKCGDCFHADLCEESKMLVGFSRDNPAYCGMFLNCADVATVVHGRWVQVMRWSNKAKYRCSVCGREIMSATKVNIEKYPYCHCGAQMDGDAENG